MWYLIWILFAAFAVYVGVRATLRYDAS